MAVLIFRFCSSAFVLLFFTGASLAQVNSKQEFRGVWVATVANIDWPSKPGLSSDQQQSEFLEIIRMHKQNGLNAILMQVRPAADAFYPSRFEPWSKFLTGKTGRAPFPYYDPLEFMIRESHSAGLEFHAWLNPYRGIINVDTANIDSATVAFKHRDWFLKYDKNLYFDPGHPDARQHVTNVVLDIVNRYDVDGIHFDDYFYPYKVAGLKFPDSLSFSREGNNFPNIDDWRRNNVTLLIKNISDSIKQVKPFVKFGVSPFGVWRNQDKDPRGSATKAGQTCYDDLYADVQLWMKEKWIDYVTPQIYWSIGFTVADYEIIAKWWSENNFGIPVYIGQAAYRINSENKDTHWKESDQIPKQIRLNRSLKNIEGSIFFSSKSFKANPLGICDSLKTNFYRYPAATPRVHATNFSQQYPLRFSTRNGKIVLSWNEPNAFKALGSGNRYIIYRYDKDEEPDLRKSENILAIVPDTNPFAYGMQHYIDDTAKTKKQYVYVVTGLDRFSNESPAKFAYAVKNNKRFWRTYPPIPIQ